MNTKILTALAGSSLVAIAVATPAFAQNSQTAQAQPPKTAQAPAQAQPPSSTDAVAAAATEEGKEKDEIIITGTQIRGATPAGSTLLTTTAAQAEERGAANGNEILADIPQASNMFQNLSALGGGVAGLVAASRLPFQAVSLRSLPNVNTGGAPTLILIDGHRVVPLGTSIIGGQGVDNSSISSANLLRTEIMPDGASAIYGSDAVTGVINYITRDSFDGIQVQARGGFAGTYKQWDGSVIAGTKWSSGNVYISASRDYHDRLLGIDRDYIHAIDANPLSPLFGTPLGLNCNAPTIAITTGGNRRLYPLTGPGGTIQSFTTNGGTNGNGVAGLAPSNVAGIAGGNRCDSTDFNSYYPKVKATNANFGLQQEILDGLTFGLKATWSKHKTQTYSAAAYNAAQPITVCGTQVTSACPQVGATGMAAPNPNYRNVNTAGAGNFFATDGGFIGTGVSGAGSNGCGVGLTCTPPQSIFTNLSSVVGPTVSSYINTETWQVTPSLTWDPPFLKDWQVRALASYGESKTLGIQGAVNTTALNPLITSGAINPYNLTASTPGSFASAFSYSALIGRFHLFDSRVVADGPLFRLPGGDVRVAVGAEYLKTDFIVSNTGTVVSTTPNNFVFDTGTGGKPLRYSQNVKSAFAEAQIPLVSAEMNVPLINSLTLAASARYDKYNDFGDTFNPMFGVTWEPVSWIKLRGNYNTSYAAPNHVTQIGTTTGAQLNNSTTDSGTAPLPFFKGITPPGRTNSSASGAISIAPALNAGTVTGIGPQTSKTWSIGFDISPPFVPGLTFGGGYYDLTLSKVIAAAFQPAVQSAFDFHPELIYCHGGVLGSAANAATACKIPMTVAELQSLFPGVGIIAGGFDPVTNPDGLATPLSLSATPNASGSATSWPKIFANYCDANGSTVNGVPNPAKYTDGAGNGSACPNGTFSVLYVGDNRQHNLGNVFARGIDFHLDYRTNVSWGSVDAHVSGTVNLETKTQPNDTAAKVDVQATGQQKFRMNASLGTTSGGLRAQVTWQHGGGYVLTPGSVRTVNGVPVSDQGTNVLPGQGNYGQLRIGAYDTFDLFFRYDFDSWADKSSLFKDLSLTLNVNNVFDTSPPVQGGGFGNGLTLGRFFQLGITKKFGGD